MMVGEFVLIDKYFVWLIFLVVFGFGDDCVLF